LKSRDSSNHQTLEQHSEGGLSSRKTSIEQPNPGYDEPDDEAAKDEVDVMILKPNILSIDVNQ
jgi:hypothetical protein